ncbi:hypothetical protein AVMA1855_22550 [Acidovorax sp. SUPP1855]|uniref:hypothetical protein n=1 Tax=Acidovorax sp. SUPP1855 TaxID=431774 RepID=UPI0023DE4DD3|nr:hypothetical protein [Acidovorax sp. SUPP1855]GKS86984.1 hypothetical protein AVMA1855_22550 [Acidovorax sp. SUPP1855]
MKNSIIKSEHHSSMSSIHYLELQAECEALDLAHAMGQDLPGHYERREVIEELMNASQWTLHPDYGCIPKVEVEKRDEAAIAGIRH